MSEVIEKTIAAIPKLLSGKLLANNPYGTGTFHHFVKTLGKINSKYEEERFIKETIGQQKDFLASPKCPLGQQRECLVTLLYCHMLDYDVSFAFIHALKLAHQGSLLEKRTGYLACTLFLQDNDELVVLLIGTILKDLCSSNVLHLAYALGAASSLLNAEMIPMVLPAVIQALNHQKELIRRKAVLCLHSFLVKAPSLVENLQPHFQKALCDKQPSVMWAALHIYTHLASQNPAAYRDMVPALLGILGQVVSRRLSTEYEHHGIPAPWLTVQLLKLLGTLAKGDESTSEQVYPMMHEVLQRTEITHKAGLAVIYECLETIAVLHPHPALLEHATACVARFLTAKSVNYKYLGVNTLTSIVRADPRYAVDHQQAVMECLNHEDKDIRDKTLELLYHMANSVNVAVISDRLLDSLTNMPDAHSKSQTIERVISLTHRCCDDMSTYLSTMSRVLILAGDLVPDNCKDQVIAFITHGGPCITASEDTRVLAVKEYWKLLQSTSLPFSLLQIGAWVLGEYSDLVVDLDVNQILQCLVVWYHRTTTQGKLSILSAFSKLLLRIDDAQPVISRLQQGENTNMEDANMQVIQRLRELSALSACASSVPKRQAEEKPDFTLSFLDDYVTRSLERGGNVYRTTSETHQAQGGLLFSGLPYASLTEQQTATDSGAASSVGSSAAQGSSSTAGSSSVAGSISAGNKHDKLSTGLILDGVQKVWGPAGNNRKKSPSPDKQEEIEATKDKELQEKEAVNDDRSELAAMLFGGISKAPKNNNHKANSKHAATGGESSQITGNSIYSTSTFSTQTLNSDSRKTTSLILPQSTPLQQDTKSAMSSSYQVQSTSPLESAPQEFFILPDTNPDSLNSESDRKSNQNLEERISESVKNLELDFDAACQENLAVAAGEFSEDEKHGAGTGVADMSPEDFVNVEQADFKGKTSTIPGSDSYQSSPCKSVGSIDTDSIEEG